MHRNICKIRKRGIHISVTVSCIVTILCMLYYILCLSFRLCLWQSMFNWWFSHMYFPTQKHHWYIYIYICLYGVTVSIYLLMFTLFFHRMNMEVVCLYTVSFIFNWPLLHYQESSHNICGPEPGIYNVWQCGNVTLSRALVVGVVTILSPVTGVVALIITISTICGLF